MNIKLQSALELAIKHGLKYSDGDPLNDDHYRKKYISAWEKYNLSVTEREVYQKLGEEINKLCKPNVLDVGSGKHMTAFALLKHVDVHKYLSIDKSIESTQYNKFSKRVENWIHYDFDIFENEILDNGQFDIIIIDIEPHGREIEIYEKIKHLGKDVHIVILKHVTYVNGYGAQCADNFIDKYKDYIYDFYGEYSTKSIRDVFLIMEKIQTKCHSKNLQDLTNGNILTYCSGIPSYIKF